MSNVYMTEVFWSDEDEGFIAIAPDLPGCSAFGETRAEAASEIESAIQAWIQAAKKIGNPIPQPTGKKGYEDQSGKFLLRMPRELHYDLAKESKKQGVSLNQYVCFLLTQKHYATHAMTEFAKNLNWETVGMSRGNQHYQVFQLSSSIPQQKTVSSTSDFNVKSFPVGAIGVFENA